MQSAARLLFLCILTLLPLAAVAQEDDPALRETFRKAYAQFTKGDLEAAKAGLRETVDAKYRLADYSLYYLAVIAYKEKDWEGGRGFLSQLRAEYPQSVWFHPAALQAARIDMAEKNFAAAADRLRRLRAEITVKNGIAEEALYLLAEIHAAEGNTERAYALYQDLRDQYPRSRWTPAARKEQARLRALDPDSFGLHTVQSLSEEADRLVRERAFGEAETLYKKLVGTVTEPELRLGYLVRLSRLYLAVRKRGEAVPLLNAVAREFPETPEAPRALFEIGNILWNRNENSAALEHLTLILDRYPTSPHTERARYIAGDIQESFGNKEAAIDYFRKAVSHSSNTQVREDATWRLAWLYYRGGEWASARAEFAALASGAKDAGLRAAGRYWDARAAERMGEHTRARDIYQQILRGSHESYYQALAARALQRLGVTFTEPNRAVPKVSAVSAAEPDPEMPAEASFHLRRARELAAIELNRLAAAELDEIQDTSKGDTRVRSLLMREYFRIHAYARSLAIANLLPETHRERNLYRFPLAYWTMIQEQATQRGLDPHLVLALIRQESLFDPNARSSAAAIGLMQLLPSTAARIAKQLGMAAPSAEGLMDPALNLVLGTQYLKDLLDRYANDWFKAIAAYNAGEAAVDRWQREIVAADSEEFVERIPYLETRGYVKLVMRNHRMYKRLYDRSS